jgi:hypothetical protein
MGQKGRKGDGWKDRKEEDAFGFEHIIFQFTVVNLFFFNFLIFLPFYLLSF